MKRDTRLHIAHATGKRVQGTCNKLFQKLSVRCKEPTKDEKATFVSDGNEQYTNAIEKYYLTETVNYAQLVKVKEGGRLVSKEKRTIFGKVDWIETVLIERYNLTLRLGISRLVRDTLCFSKAKGMLDKHLELYQCYSNLIRKHIGLGGKTPCMAEGITNHKWTWEEMLTFKILTLVY